MARKEAEPLVVLTRARSEAEAQLIVAVLRSAGIAGSIEGASLWDEWALSQRMLGRMGHEVKVAASSLDRAQAELARAREAGTIEEAAD